MKDFIVRKFCQSIKELQETKRNYHINIYSNNIHILAVFISWIWTWLLSSPNIHRTVPNLNGKAILDNVNTFIRKMNFFSEVPANFCLPVIAQNFHKHNCPSLQYSCKKTGNSQPLKWKWWEEGKNRYLREPTGGSATKSPFVRSLQD